MPIEFGAKVASHSPQSWFEHGYLCREMVIILSHYISSM